MNIAKHKAVKIATLIVVLLVFVFISTGCNRVDFMLLHDRNQIQSIYLTNYSMIDTSDLSVLPNDSVQISDIESAKIKVHQLNRMHSGNLIFIRKVHCRT